MSENDLELDMSTKSSLTKRFGALQVTPEISVRVSLDPEQMVSLEDFEGHLAQVSSFVLRFCYNARDAALSCGRLANKAK